MDRNLKAASWPFEKRDRSAVCRHEALDDGKAES